MRDSERLSEKIERLATGNWPGILEAAHVDARHLVNKAGPCPVCGNPKPKFRFDNKGGRGTWICTCGAGDGMKLLMACTEKSFTEAALWVLDHLDDPERAKKIIARSRQFPSSEADLTPEKIEERRRLFRRVWKASSRAEPGDALWTYLTRRLPGLAEIPRCIRLHPGLEYRGPGAPGKQDRGYGRHPVMLAAMVDDDGRCCNLHRTYLTADGHKLSLLEDGVELPSKKLMPAVGARSYSVRLAEHSGKLGVAEGIETALAAMIAKGLPTWAVVSTAGMKSFNVPADVQELTIFADNDNVTRQGKRPGFDAANALAQRDDVVTRVRAGTLKVKVVTPARRGQDMADMLLEMAALREAA